MKPIRLFFLFILLLFFCLFTAQAGQESSGSTATYFKWIPGSANYRELISPENGFSLEQGSYTVTGPQKLRRMGEQLLHILIDSERMLAVRYQLLPGNRRFLIPLISAASLRGADHQFTLFSEASNRMVFPFPVDEKTSLKSTTNQFSLFSLLHTLIRANLAYGSRDRLPVSSHAFRFIDGISGFLALEVITVESTRDAEKYLDILSARYQREQSARRFSAAQLLAQNSNSEDTDILAGLNQFFSGIGLTRNSEGTINPADRSSTADRIRLFQWIQANKGPETIQDIIGYLSRSSGIWIIEEITEDSFCREYIHFGCREKTIDGSRSDIILQYTTGMNFAQLLKQSKKEAGNIKTKTLAHYPVYGFDYPKAGGANANIIGLHVLHDSVTINADDILDAETIAMYGASLELAIHDEAYQVQIQIDYTTGNKNRDESLLINNIRQTVPQSITSTDLQIGSRVLKTGYHSGWQDELGVFFHWKRLQVEWDTKNVTGKKTDKEYINSGFFLLDVQNTKAWMISRNFALGLNYDFQLGLVNQSGSTRVARSEKYNTDTSNLVLGVNLGPELRIGIPSVLLNIRLGGTADFLWQPINDEGGKSEEDNDINASQSRVHLFATVGLLF